ncbi:HypC/HybG/HupF family hydrogenase formation chaperone [bacterium]|nr:HypC/HybG/HupF family hydrogenase formation chaperone [bacterium]
MCLAVPIKIIEVNDIKAIGEIEGVKREVNVSLIPEVKIGEYVLLHAGFAIQIIDEEAAKEILSIWKDLLKKL